ncbi:MAG: hypothetical protein KF819_02240 [Labilithrix sp.]|nr:hypothetical protein [Labilithrix sp.]
MARARPSGLLEALAAAVVAVAVACSRDVPAVSDGGPLGSTKGATECPGVSTTCDLTNGERCCFAPDSGTGACATSCSPGSYSFVCDDSMDCPEASRCCVDSLVGGSYCAPRCGADQLCRTNDECAQGVACLPMLCRGRATGTCGVPREVVTSFCNP